jgi:hypothetical protein
MTQWPPFTGRTDMAPLLAALSGWARQPVDAARGLRPVTPMALVLWEPAGAGYYERTVSGDTRDLLVSGLLAQGWMLLAGDPQRLELPLLPGWRLVASGQELTLYDPDDYRLLAGITVPPLGGWEVAVQRQGVCGLIAGTGIGLRSGRPGLLAAMRAGRVAGAVVAVGCEVGDQPRPW